MKSIISLILNWQSSDLCQALDGRRRSEKKPPGSKDIVSVFEDIDISGRSDPNITAPTVL